MALFAVVVGGGEERAAVIEKAERRLARFPGDRWTTVTRPGFALVAWQRWFAPSTPPQEAWDVTEAEGWVAVVSGHVVIEGENFIPQSAGLAANLLRDFIRDPLVRPRFWRGQFSFVAWHETSQTLYLVRDPFGIEPLYWGRLPNGGFAVANLAKTLVAMGVASDPDSLGWSSFFLWGFVDGVRTVYSGVEGVRQGHVGVLNRAEGTVRWHEHTDLRSLWAVPSAPTFDPQEARQAVHEALLAALHDAVGDRRHVALFLSGGIDSGAVAGAVAEGGWEAVAYTLAFAEFAGTANDETPWAERIAHHYQLPHRVGVVEEAEFWAALPDFLDAMDQPTLDGINFWLACRHLAQAGERVACTGDGGDELFGGFRKLTQWRRAATLVRWAKRFPFGMALVDRLFAAYGAVKRRPKWRWAGRYLEPIDHLYFVPYAIYFPEELDALGLAGVADAARARLAEIPFPEVDCLERAMQMRDSYHSMTYLYLGDAHWIGAAHGLQLAHPLASVRLLKTVAPWICHFRGRVGKRLLASAPQPPLPQEVVDRPKGGFATPVAHWLAQRVFPALRFPEVAREGAIERRLAWWLYERWPRA